MKTNHIRNATVKLETYKPSYDKLLNLFYLPKEQLIFTGLPKEMLMKVNKNEHPIMITVQSKPVGFFILLTGERVKEYTDHPQAQLLIAFSIDYKEQGKGYAKKGLQLLPDFVKKHFPHIGEIVLGVNKKNRPAHQLYEKSGFQDRGRRKIGSVGEQIVMHLSLE